MGGAVRERRPPRADVPARGAPVAASGRGASAAAASSASAGSSEASAGSPVRGAVAGSRKRPAPWYRDGPPNSDGSSPDIGCPSPTKRVWANSTMSGWVNMNTTIRSAIAVRPRVNAKPRTLPTATKYSTTAASRFTALDAVIVRRARFQPSCTATGTVWPARSSSLMRSK